MHVYFYKRIYERKTTGFFALLLLLLLFVYLGVSLSQWRKKKCATKRKERKIAVVKKIKNVPWYRCFFPHLFAGLNSVLLFVCYCCCCCCCSVVPSLEWVVRFCALFFSSFLFHRIIDINIGCVAAFSAR